MSLLSDLRARFKREHVNLHLDDIQAIILRSRPEPYVGIHALIRVDDAAGGREFLTRLAPHVPSAADWTDDVDSWTGVGISHAGLTALGVPKVSLDSFPLSFQQGMAGRALQLIDRGVNAPEHWEDVFATGTCHITLTIYARDEKTLESIRGTALGVLDGGSGVSLVGTHQFGAGADGKNPFGFRDSVSQPTIAGSGITPAPTEQRAVAAGEFILGEDSESGAPVAMPSPVDLGRNGSFAVLRKYVSQVGAFNDFCGAHADAEGGGEQGAHRVGAKMFGRWRSGAPLVLAPGADDEVLGADAKRNNDFSYAEDKAGLMCPHSSHMRRLNPRDSPLSILTDVNIHRIVRRSSTFGPAWTPAVTTADDAKGDRGIYFIFISARAYDTIEFMQQEWINGGNFIDLGEEEDPVAALHDENHTFTIPHEPARIRVDGVPTFNEMKGGEYLFIPSLTALRWIGAGDWSAKGAASPGTAS